MIKVTCQINEYDNPQKASLKVHSHWNESSKVELEVDGQRYVVIGRELIEAIKNCMNTSKY